DWINNRHWTREQLIEVMRDHISTVVGRYKNRIYAWDVVNEGIDDETLGLRPSKWTEVIGPEYIDLAFQFAHEADPNALLFYNDYGGEGLGEKSDAIYNLLKDLRSRDIPVDGVGLQMHVTLDDYIPPDELRASIRRLADLGLVVHITEMDVAIPEPVTPKKLKQQAQIYRDALEVCLSEPACEAFLVWGFTEKHHWLNDVYHPDTNYEAACLYDESYQPKPAFFSLQQLMMQP
ncbi:MAG: endo-1,4-beta-xylanase, partial [Anaerolinea sp.]|nr:endo-1,4-beta-xylanase [Anaerolinea sp.]